jgi:hypothetical protein
MPGIDDEAQYQIRALARDLRKTKARINRLHGTCGVSPDAAGCPEQSGGKRIRRRKRTKKKTRRKRKRRKRRRKSRKRKAGASSARRNINHNRNILGKIPTLNEILSQHHRTQQEEKIPTNTEMTAFLLEMLLGRDVLVAGYEEPYNRGTVVNVINHQALIVEMQYPSDEGEIQVSAFNVTPIP